MSSGQGGSSAPAPHQSTSLAGIFSMANGRSVSISAAAKARGQSLLQECGVLDGSEPDASPQKQPAFAASHLPAHRLPHAGRAERPLAAAAMHLRGTEHLGSISALNGQISAEPAPGAAGHQMSGFTTGSHKPIPVSVQGLRNAAQLLGDDCDAGLPGDPADAADKWPNDSADARDMPLHQPEACRPMDQDHTTEQHHVSDEQMQMSKDLCTAGLSQQPEAQPPPLDPQSEAHLNAGESPEAQQNSSCSLCSPAPSSMVMPCLRIRMHPQVLIWQAICAKL